MALRIVSADERMKESTNPKILLAGAHKIGKTSQLWTLPGMESLFIDFEAGELAVKKWQGDKISPETWDEAVIVASIFGGPDMSRDPSARYSKEFYEYHCNLYPDLVRLRDKYRYNFYDSISVASRLCFRWAEMQPESFTQEGKKNVLGTYGLVGREIVEWLTHIQHTKDKVVIVASGLDPNDDFTHPWVLQIEGKQGANKMPGIFDEVITMAEINDGTSAPYRAFVCHKVNPWKYPAGDRSGCLELLEEPNLFKVIQKIEAGKRLIQPESYNYTIPETKAQEA